MEETSALTVSIFGREYKIRGDADETYIREMAKYVDEKMKKLSTHSSLPSQDRLAVLAALNITDELFQERNKTSETVSSVERRAGLMITLLEQNLLTEK